MKICVIGQYVRDEIHLHDERILESHGGIFFALGAFSAITSAGDSVHPIFPVGNDCETELRRAMEKLHRIIPKDVFTFYEPTTRVKLFYSTPTAYQTCLVSELPPLPFEKIIPHLDADVIYINMMTAQDITIEVAEQVRSRTGALIFLDVHMLAYEVGEMGKRELRPNPDWKRWCSIADVVQMNEREASAFLESDLDVSTVVERIFETTNVAIVIITRGENGAFVYERKQEGFRKHEILAHSIDAIADTTGCGDSFGAAFAFHFRKYGNAHNAGVFASFVASRGAMLHGSDGIEQLQDLLQNGVTA